MSRNWSARSWVPLDADLGALGTDWSIVGIGDFNGDGTADILARQNTGAIRDYNMTNGDVGGVRDFGALGSDWSILPDHSTIFQPG
jgi:hypothetical protein